MTLKQIRTLFEALLPEHEFVLSSDSPALTPEDENKEVEGFSLSVGSLGYKITSNRDIPGPCVIRGVAIDYQTQPSVVGGETRFRLIEKDTVNVILNFAHDRNQITAWRPHPDVGDRTKIVVPEGKTYQLYGPEEIAALVLYEDLAGRKQ